MNSMVQFVGLVMATIFAGASATAIYWLFLQAAVRMMQPATARTRRPVRSELVRGTQELIRHFAPQR